jgi:hypothetical protein
MKLGFICLNRLFAFPRRVAQHPRARSSASEPRCAARGSSTIAGNIRISPGKHQESEKTGDNYISPRLFGQLTVSRCPAVSRLRFA